MVNGYQSCSGGSIPSLQSPSVLGLAHLMPVCDGSSKNAFLGSSVKIVTNYKYFEIKEKSKNDNYFEQNSVV